MSSIRSASAVVVAVVLLGVFLAQPGVASAIEPTALCSKAQSECAEENLYPVGTKLTATSTNLIVKTSLGNVACASSKAEGATTADYGYSLPIEISSLSFSTCKLGSLSCTMKAKNLPYGGWLEEAGTESSFEVPESTGGAITLEASCGVITCTFTAAEPALSASNGETLALTATNVNLEGVPIACEPGTVNANFTVKTAGGANVFGVELATPPVKLTPKNPPVRGPLKIGLGKNEEITVKSERPYKLKMLVNGPAGNFELQATNCPAIGAELNAFASCKDTVGPIAGAAKGDKGWLNVTVERPGFIPPAIQVVRYRLLAN